MLYHLTEIGFALLTVVFYYLLYCEFKVALPKTTFSVSKQKKFLVTFLVTFLFWTLLASVLSLTGYFGNFERFPLNVGPFMFIPLLTIIIFTFSKTTSEILFHIPPANLIRLQVFRIFVEILLWMLFLQNLAPIQMTFEGYNFDILAGISAIVIAYLSSHNKLSKTALLIWNIASLGLLINIVAIAILSMPTPIRYFMKDPANTIVTQFPISLLPTLLVPLAYMLHFLSLRQLKLKR